MDRTARSGSRFPFLVRRISRNESAFFAAKYQLRALEARGSGSLIFTSTFVGYTAGIPGMAAYAASKAGLIGLTQVLADGGVSISRT